MFLYVTIIIKSLCIYYMNSRQFSVALFFVMFIYSGFNKIFNFKNKVTTLTKKTGLPPLINQLGMFGVILLEIIGSIIIILYFFNCDFVSFDIVTVVNYLFLLFLVVVTFLYHPPWQAPIPFLSNVTTFAGLLFLRILLLERYAKC